jgi:1,4-dihydroxy-6-naphthoate synthase
MKPSLRLNISPCPNDTFMFHALLHHLSETEGLSFHTGFHDIETLNQLARANAADVIKISCAHYPEISQHYQLLTSGAAMGYGNGPLLIARNPFPLSELPRMRIAIPGWHTTAHLLLSIAHPDATHKEVMLFSDIEQALTDHRADAGLLIHETRFTFQKRGLVSLEDLGTWWEETTGLPIPLGAVAVRRDLPEATKQALNRSLSASVAYALAHPEASANFVREYAQSMDPDVCQAHIHLYVNEFSVHTGEKGTLAMRELFSRGHHAGLLHDLPMEPVFV